MEDRYQGPRHSQHQAGEQDSLGYRNKPSPDYGEHRLTGELQVRAPQASAEQSSYTQGDWLVTAFLSPWQGTGAFRSAPS